MDNMPECIIEVFKTDSVTGNPVGGAEFEVADSTGKVIEYITTDVNGRAYSQVLKPGEYLVKETKAPAGYSKDETQHRVTIKEGQNALLQVKNVPDTSVHITKIGASSKAPVAGAVFELYETCGIEPCIKVGQYTTDEYGQAVTEPLAPGIYKLKEIIAPAGYVLDETEYEVCVKAGEYNNIIIENQEAATLTVRKIDSKTGKPIAGAVFKLETASNKLIGTLESDANGEAIFTGLTAGELLEQRLASPYFESLAPEYEVYGELPGPTQRAYIRRLVQGISVHGYELDQYIEKYAKGWRFERIPLVAGAIMRLAMYEILYMPEIPNGAAINEAVEIAKGYLDDEVVKFINGILGSFVRSEVPELE